MADPRSFSIEDRLKAKERLSPLMRALRDNRTGEKVNVCPFDENIEHLDDNGYCEHLVGFTIPGNPKKMEPYLPPHPETGRRFVDGADIQDVKPTDKLIEITQSCRVYRNVKKAEVA